jgi:hypothetical protein
MRARERPGAMKLATLLFQPFVEMFEQSAAGFARSAELGTAEEMWSRGYES